MKKNGIDTTTNLPMGAILHDGMGCLVQDLRPVLDIIIEPGTKFAPFQDLKSEDVEKVFRLDQIRQGKGNPELELNLADVSTRLFMFGMTSAGMTSAANNRSPKQRSKHTSKKGRRS